MNPFRTMACAIAILASAGCASDGAHRKSAAPPAVAKSEPAAKSQDVAISCSVERAVGTNIPKKSCMTAQQREAARKQAAESVKDMQRGGGAGNRESGL